MMVLISGVTAIALYVAQQQVEGGEQEALQKEFRAHLGYVLGVQQTWHAAIADRCRQLARSVRITAALEENDTETVYRVAEEFELRGTLEKPGETEAGAPRAKFFRFLDTQGKLLPKPGIPPAPWEATLSPRGGVPEKQTLAYVAAEVGGVPTIYEVLTTPIVAAATGELTGAVVLGFEPAFAAAASQRDLTSGIWFDGRMYYPGARKDPAPALNAEAIGRAITSRTAEESVPVPVGGVPHLLFFNRLDRGTAARPAYQICLYSLADSLARLERLRWQIVVAGALLLVAGLLASHFLSRRFSAPMEQLAQVSAQNVARRERVEAELVLTEQKYRSIYQNAVEGIYLLSPEGRFLTANPALARIFGYESPAALCAALTEPDRQIFVETGRNAELLRRASEPGGVSDFESEVLRADGRKIWIVQNARAVRDEQGRIAHFEGTLQDISERKRASDALVVLNGELEKALSDLKGTQQQIIQQERLRALGQMASGIAHDFNNALVPILGFCELLQHNPSSLRDTAKTLKYLGMIQTAATDATKVVARLREFYRSRDHREAFAPVDLTKLVTQVVTMTQPRWKDQAQANGSTIHIRTELQTLPPLAGDDSALREVLTNLIFNAVDAMPKGGTITLRTHRLGDSAVLEVADTGTGMSEEVRTRCMEPFFSTKGERGTGLGLSMVFGIIRRHSGLVDIRSAPGKGTTFVITLPLHQITMEETNGAAPAAAAPTRKLRVLVVDDEEPVRELLEAALTDEGHTVEMAAHGADGLRRFLDGNFDLIITDKAMPGMSGDQLASAIKEIAPKIPIILLTGFGQFLDPQEYPKVDVLAAKPVSLPALRDAIATALQEA
jgi:PAS domain S-box-containing protein